MSLKRVWRTEVVLPLLLVTNAGLLMLDRSILFPNVDNKYVGLLQDKINSLQM